MRCFCWRSSTNRVTNLFQTRRPTKIWRTASNEWAEPRFNWRRGASDNLNVSPLTPIICRPAPLWIRARDPNRVVLHAATNVWHLCDFEDAVFARWSKKAVLLPIDNCPYVREPCFDSRREHLGHSPSSLCRHNVRACMNAAPLQHV